MFGVDGVDPVPDLVRDAGGCLQHLGGKFLFAEGSHLFRLRAPQDRGRHICPGSRGRESQKVQEAGGFRVRQGRSSYVSRLGVGVLELDAPGLLRNKQDDACCVVPSRKDGRNCREWVKEGAAGRFGRLPEAFEGFA